MLAADQLDVQMLWNGNMAWMVGRMHVVDKSIAKEKTVLSDIVSYSLKIEI
jgi:hypothetical protein